MPPITQAEAEARGVKIIDGRADAIAQHAFDAGALERLLTRMLQEASASIRGLRRRARKMERESPERVSHRDVVEQMKAETYVLRTVAGAAAIGRRTSAGPGVGGGAPGGYEDAIMRWAGENAP